MSGSFSWPLLDNVTFLLQLQETALEKGDVRDQNGVSPRGQEQRPRSGTGGLEREAEYKKNKETMTLTLGVAFPCVSGWHTAL